MVKTFGLTHISLAVRDLERSLHFYRELLGATVVFRNEKQIQLQTPGAKDILALESREESARAGEPAGITHFGFRLLEAADVDHAIAEAERAGGKLIVRGEFRPGAPFAYLADPDGYKIEIWFE